MLCVTNVAHESLWKVLFVELAPLAGIGDWAQLNWLFSVSNMSDFSFIGDFIGQLPGRMQYSSRRSVNQCVRGGNFDDLIM